MLALARIAIEPDQRLLSPLITTKTRNYLTNNGWELFASFSWAFVMYLFRWRPEAIQSSLRSSMTYM